MKSRLVELVKKVIEIFHLRSPRDRRVAFQAVAQSVLARSSRIELDGMLSREVAIELAKISKPDKSIRQRFMLACCKPGVLGPCVAAILLAITTPISHCLSQLTSDL